MNPEPTVPESRFVERLKGKTLDRQTDAVLIVDQNQCLVYLNQAARRVFGYRADGKIPQLAELAEGLRNGDDFLALVAETLEGTNANHPFTVQTGEREAIGILHCTPVLSQGICTHAVFSFHDNTRFMRLQRRMSQDEFLDRVTGLYNRKTLDIMFNMEIEKAERDPENSHLAVMMIQIRNLDQFKAVYDDVTINHILEHIGSSVRSSLRTHDLVFRYDENRLVALVSQFGWKSDLLIMAKRIEDHIAIPFHPQDTYIHLRAESSICVFPEDGATSGDLLINSIAALSEAHETNQSILMFNQETYRLAKERLEIRSSLSTAVRENQLELYYMPIVGPDRRVKGVEALIRWNHPERGILTPDVFLPIAIHSRIISGISRWVMYRAQEDYRNWFAESDIFLTFNLSAKDFADKFLIEGLDSSLAGGVKSSRIKVEITEGELIEDFDLCSTMLEQLRQRGIGIFIDDFGVGQSSLAYLHDIPAECIKVDHSFMMRIEGPGKEYDFLEAVVRLCKVLDRQILLEGVETEQQFSLFRNCGADMFQGYLFGKPMPASDLAQKCLLG